jgi:hypothetical protein
MSPYLASNASERLTTARQRLLDLQRGLDAALAAAGIFNDLDLTAEGLGNRRTQLEHEAREMFVPQIQELAAEVAEDVQTVKDHGAQLRPTAPSDAVGLQRAQQAWDRVRLRLDAGMSLPSIIAGADQETLLAIAEPQWLEAEQFKAQPSERRLTGYRPPDFTWIGRLVDARLAELVGGDFAQALEAAKDADVAEALVGPVVGDLQSQCVGGPSDPFRAAIDAAVAAQFVESDYAVAGAKDGPWVA